MNVPATADGNKIELKTAANSQLSTKVRYAWKDDPKADVRSLTGIPMSSFELTINN